MTKIVTHNGHFHTDDLLAVASLLLIYPDAEVFRSRDAVVIESGDIVVDVGQIHDPVARRFDHHQAGGAGERPNKIPYASFGLVWQEFGKTIAGGEGEAKVIDDKLVAPVDALDNGVALSVSNFDGINEYNLGDYFESFASGVKTLEEYDETFKKLLPVAKDLLKREIGLAKVSVADWKKVEDLYNLSENKKIIVLPEVMHWKRVLIPRETVYVVAPRQDGRWMTRAVPKFVHSFETKKPFPSNWGGLNDGSLAEVTGVADVVTCHKDRHLAVVKSKNGAIKLAEIALNA